MGKLTLKTIRALTRPGMHGDGGTLYLRVAPGGSKQWVQRLQIHGRQRDIGLGGFSLVTLAEAREAAFENRRIARRGGDPLAIKRDAAEAANVPTFADAVEATIKAHRPNWRGATTERNWRRLFELYAIPTLGARRLDSIGPKNVLRILAPLWTDRPEQARNLRRRMVKCFEWGMANGYMNTNPAGEAINGALPAKRQTKQHHRAMPFAEVREALDIVESSTAGMAVKAAFRFLILTAARYGEVRGALWSEIDLGARTWTIPATRMKSGRKHRVPLSKAAVGVLEGMKPLRGRCGHVFTSPKGSGALGSTALRKLINTTGLIERTTIHGLRSSFRDWCAERSVDREIAEAALAHIVAGTEGAYLRSDLFNRRAVVMQQWAEYLELGTAQVVTLRTG